MCDLVPLLPLFPTFGLCFAWVHSAPVFLNVPRLQYERIAYVTVWHTFCCNVLPYAKAVPKWGWG